MLAPGEIFEFGDFMLDPAERLLLVRGRGRGLTAEAFDLLLVLVRHRGRLVSKDQLLEEVWPSTFVAEVNSRVNIPTLRKLLGRDRQAFIETLPKQGYRFVAPVRVRKGVTTTFLRRPDERSPNAEDAHRACLQGRYHWNRRTAEALERAKLHFWRAIAFDPNYAPAYAGLADSYATEGAL